MGLLETDVLDGLLHSSTISKGIERTMEYIINELEVDHMYIVHYENDMAIPEIAYEWENGQGKKSVDFNTYVDNMTKWTHFDEQDFFAAQKMKDLSKDEKQFYKTCGYKTVVEYRMTNYGNNIGYMILGWEHARTLDEEEEHDLHILLKLMNEHLARQFREEAAGLDDWQIYKLISNMTKTMFYLIDEDYKIQYINDYVKESYPNIKVGDLCYCALQGESTPCKTCPLRDLVDGQLIEQYKYFPFLQDTLLLNVKGVQMSENKSGYAMTLQKLDYLQPKEKRGEVGRKFIFALDSVYKDIIAVDLRHDVFYNLLKKERDNRYSYSIDFVLKWMSKLHLDDKQKFVECFDINFLQNDYEKGIKTRELDFRYRTHEGSYHCMNARLLFEYSVNKQAMVYILFADVEQLRSVQIEEQRKLKDSLLAARSSAELKGELLANISHEIRTPMSGIISMASVAKQIYKQEDKLLECLANIDEYAGHMMQIMDSLLDTVKVNDDAITIAKQPFRLDQLLNRIDIAFRSEIEKKNIQFYMENTSRYNRLIGDEIRLYQAMITLVKNAISYTQAPGNIRLSTKQVAIDAKTVFIRFMIEGSGNGLSEKMKQSLFGFSNDQNQDIVDEESFELSLAAKIIRLMGSDIGVNVNEAGTQLHFTIPFGLHEEEKNKSIKKQAAVDSESFKGKRVLLAEDSEMGQDALRAVLEVVGFTVDAVDNGKKAVIQFISNPAQTYDVILMDVHMPIMDGREATRCIRISGKEDGASIPIIGLMANTYDEDVKESIDAGMQEHLSKPVDVDRLYKVLRKVMKDKCE